jgi:hypothetical protein
MFLNRYKSMKKNFNILGFILSLLMIFAIASCKKDEKGGSGAPTITRVRLLSKTDTIPDVEHRITLDSSSTYNDTRIVPFDSTVVAGRLGNQYAIIGSNLATTMSVSFNGVNVYFNPALLTDNSIIVTLPSNTSTVLVPYGSNQSNKLVVVTNHGQVEYDFPILQPPATITGFDVTSGAQGDEVTIKGTVFNGVTAVRFDDVPATIIGTPTATEVRVKVPAGISQAFIYVVTPGGVAKSTLAYGFKYIIFDEQLNPANSWGKWGGWDTSEQVLPSTEHPKGGLNSFKIAYLGAYGAIQLHPDVAFPLPNGFSSLKLSIYGGANATATSQVAVYLKSDNGVDPTDAQKVKLTLVPGSYNSYQIPLSAFSNNPANINEFVIQNYGTANLTIYVDDIGFN